MTLEGIYGTAISVSSTLIILFTIYGAVLGLYERGEPVEPVTLAAELDRLGLLARGGEILKDHRAIPWWLYRQFRTLNHGRGR